MSKIKPGLGRGLDALINPRTDEDVNEPIAVRSSDLSRDDGQSVDVLAKISVDLIEPNPYQPRNEFDSESLDELRRSILQNGLIQPVTVRRTENNKYQLISGERRLRACKDIGHKEIPAYIIKVETKEAMVALALIENIQREELNPIEVAHAYYQLMTECNLTQESIAEKIGKNRSTITNTLRLLKLPDEVKEAIISGEITQGHARALINLNSPKEQLEILSKIIKDGLNVRKVESLVRNYSGETRQKIKISKEKLSYPPSPNRTDIENKLRKIFATKVLCRQKKNGAGEIVIEFYNEDDLERLFDLFEVIEKNSY